MKKALSLLMAALLLLPLGSALALEEDPARLAVNTACVKAFLDSRDYVYSYDESRDLFTCDFSLDNSFRTCTLYAVIYDNGLSVRVSFAKVPPAREAKAALLGIWLNYELRVGKFTMDHDDGELCFEYSLCTEEAAPTQEAVSTAILLPLLMADAYGEGFYQIIYEDAEAEAAYSSSME